MNLALLQILLCENRVYFRSVLEINDVEAIAKIFKTESILLDAAHRRGE